MDKMSWLLLNIGSTVSLASFTLSGWPCFIMTLFAFMLHTTFKPDAASVTMHTAIGTFVEVCDVNLAAVDSVKPQV